MFDPGQDKPSLLLQIMQGGTPVMPTETLIFAMVILAAAKCAYGTILSLISIKAGFRFVVFNHCHEGGEPPRRNSWLNYCNRYFGDIGLCRVLPSQLKTDLLPSECPLTASP